jgi:hypothetical protein
MYVRHDDAGENASTERSCKEMCSGIKFNFSGTRTSQRNGKVERKFQKL